MNALMRGASGYLLKGISDERLASTLRAAHEGEPALSRSLVPFLVDEIRREEIADGRKILSAFRRDLPRARITWIEGNHEFRLRRYLIQNARVRYGVPGLSVPELIGLLKSPC